MPLKVRIDTSFFKPLLKYLKDSNIENLRLLTEHPAAFRTHQHAVRFGNTKSPILEFWKKLLEKYKTNNNAVVERIKSGLNYIYNEQSSFTEMINELNNYAPKGINVSTNLFTIVGYDMGIVSEGTALVSLDHNLYLNNPEELLYMSMHQLHHVIYTAYNEMFRMADIQMTNHLVEVIRYRTHLEGLGVFVPYELRKRNNAFANDDYKILRNKKLSKKRVSEFFGILTKYQTEPVRSIHEKDWKILDLMTGKKRLWYIAGAHMAQTIEDHSGRAALNDTIRLGPGEFFRQYHDAI
jgi:hypothetical protein